MSEQTYPARVSGKAAMAMLGIAGKVLFRKVVDANPQIVHRLAGEVRPKYLTRELHLLLVKQPVPGVRALGEAKRT